MIPPFDPRRDGWPHGPDRLVLVGPPGTGKTRSILGHWIVPALRAGLGERDVLVCSFTKAAAGEVSARLAAELGGVPRDYRLTSSTVHAEAFRLLRDQVPGVALHESGGSRLSPDEVDEDEDPAGSAKLRKAARSVWDFARNVLAEGETVIERVQAVAERFRSDQRVARFQIEELAGAIEEYEDEKRQAHKIDFTDMLAMGLERGYVVARELLVVDEVQDTSPLQWELVRAWARRARTVVLVGDHDQAVHVWCGADAHPMIQYARGAEGFQARRLAQSHRVPRAAHRLARALILQEPGRLDAPYEPAPRRGRARELDRTDVVETLAEAARLQVPALVLARSSKVLGSGIGDSLRRLGVPYLSERGYSPLGAPSAVAVARVLAELRAGRPALSADLRPFLKELPAKGYKFFSGLKKDAQLEVGGWPETGLVPLAALEALGLRLDQLLDGPLEGALRTVLGAPDGREKRDRAADLALLVERWGTEVLRTRPSVVLTSMHASKGREADLVVVDLATPRPVARALAEGEGEADERRTVYVALTRTKDELVLVRSPGDLGELLGLEVAVEVAA